ncbi:MAG: Flp pilus assembly protein CpaB [Clostridiales bacterium]|nr:Flp pilus assembly protein CpaB [Clostridiales bacterium]
MKKVYLIATFVAIIAGISTYLFASQIQKSTKIKDAPTSSVVVAVQPIKENTILTAEMFEVKLFTTVAVVPGSAAKMEDVVGKMNRYPIAAGEQVLVNKIISVGEKNVNVALSYELLPREYAYTITVDSVQGVAGFITRGDYVDVLFTSNDEQGNYKTEIILQDVYVLRLANNAANKIADAPNGQPITAYVEVTFKLSEEQIIKFSNYLAQGPVRLVLKPITTGENVTDIAS